MRASARQQRVGLLDLIDSRLGSLGECRLDLGTHHGVSINDDLVGLLHERARLSILRAASSRAVKV